ncbi:MAG: hypothetical protein D6689_00160 [Deltaproteobacteria bacterium]|nr:MAG: hypothetical protein D6689_00160 [Deltaproteobacteria bacterium]
MTRGSELLADGERALAAGDSERAYEVLCRARDAGVGDEDVPRLAAALGTAARFVGRHADVLDWIEQVLAGAADPVNRARFERARVAVCRQVDVRRVLSVADGALAAAEAVGDQEAYAEVLSHVAFAAYRSGDRRTAARCATEAETRTFSSQSAQYDALRARMFAAILQGHSELALSLSKAARDVALATGRRADAANESNNIAETLLELGRPEAARDEATVAAELARETGHRQVESFARVLMALATAECGNLDPALDMLARVPEQVVNHMFAVDAAAAEAFWLLERGAAGDAARARDVAGAAIEEARGVGASNKLTHLYSALARAHARTGDADAARAALELARRSLDKTEPSAELYLALAFTEVFPVTEAARRTALGNARSRILRAASRRDDPRAYCLRVRVHRRLLELSGGVPADLLA